MTISDKNLLKGQLGLWCHGLCSLSLLRNQLCLLKSKDEGDGTGDIAEKIFVWPRRTSFHIDVRENLDLSKNG